MDTFINFLLQFKEIIVALIAVFGVVLPYLGQRNKEYKLKLAEQKIAAYSEFSRDFTETAVLIMHDQKVGSKLWTDKECWREIRYCYTVVMMS